MRPCSACRLVLPDEAFPRNRTGPCRTCHNSLARARYAKHKALQAATAILDAEEAVWQLWGLQCMACGEEVEARRRATVLPFRTEVGAEECPRCNGAVWASLISGPATLGAAEPELARLAARRR